MSPVKYLSPATSTAIIRCPRASFRLVWSALTYISYVPATDSPAGKRPSGGRERPCVFRVLRVSGTMRKAEEEAIRRARREIARTRGVQESSVLGELVSSASDGAQVTSLQSSSVKSIVDERDDDAMLEDSDDN